MSEYEQIYIGRKSGGSVILAAPRSALRQRYTRQTREDGIILYTPVVIENKSQNFVGVENER